MKEIGSEFWSAPTQEKPNNFFPLTTKFFLSGRHALEYIVLDSNIKSVSMPRWCCESMFKPFLKFNVKVEFYDKQPNYNLDAIFLIDYFGLSSFSSNIKLKKYSGVVIRDITHSMFSKQHSDANYYFGSLRKWAGFVTGGFAFGDWKNKTSVPEYDQRYVNLRLRAFSEKKEYIDNKRIDKTYLTVYKEANNLLDNIYCSKAYPEDVEKAKHLNIDLIKKVRRKNAKYLVKGLNLPIKMNNKDVPLFVPIFINNRDKLRKYLIDNHVYCPIHWPKSDVDGTELSLVCDQRYDLDDMKRIVSLVKEFEVIFKK